METVSELEKKAIDFALKQDWKKAITYNKKILKKDKNNLDSLLRLGFAMMQLKKYLQAKKYYKKALKIQPYNPTAIENLNRIKIILSKKEKLINEEKDIHLDPNLFLEIPGKTKTISLVNLGQKDILAQLSIGEKVNLKLRKRRVEIRTSQGDYIGHLPDDLSKRLQILIKAGSQFSAFIKEASFNKVVVFIREEKRGKKVYKFFPFPLTKKTLPDYVEKEIAQEKIEEKSQELTDADLEELANILIDENEKIDEYLPFKPDYEEEEEE